MSQDDFVSAYQNQLCLNLQRCCTLAGLGLDTSLCSSLYADAGLGTSSTAFNPQAAAQCISDMGSSARCRTTNAVPSCLLVYGGSRAPGESCTADVECAIPEGGEARCDALRGICVAGVPGQLNDACQQSCDRASNGAVSCVWGPSSTETAGGAYVVNCFSNDGLTCGAEGRCVALAGVGQYCTADSSCGRSLFCSTASVGSSATCQARSPVGSSCADYAHPCVDTAYCSAGSCVAKKREGEHCLSNTECLGVCDCRPSGDCASVGLCADPDAVAASITATIVSLTYCSATTTQ